MKPVPARADPPADSLPVAVPDSSSAAGTPTIASDVLFGSHRELAISHAGAVYRLRITQQNKLILTK